MADEELMTVVVGEPAEIAAEEAPEDWPLDEVCAAAVDSARQALLNEADEAQVGEHLAAVAEGPLVVTHYFEGHVAGYTGWQWAVSLTRAPDSDEITIDETALLPDGDALLAPAWVPWKQRIESGDLKAGDVLVTEVDDPRLVAGLSENDTPDEDEDLRPPEWELGVGRERMLSPEGRREAAHRWYREVGPRSPIARAADLHCATCGFLMLIGGPLGQAFGVCANGYSPVDGRIVAMTFGCGAHSETTEKPAVGVAETVIDEVGYDEYAVAEEPAEADAEPQAQSSEVDAEPQAQSSEVDAEPQAQSSEVDAERQAQSSEVDAVAEPETAEEGPTEEGA